MDKTHDEIRNAVREQYAKVATSNTQGCATASTCNPGCCAGGSNTSRPSLQLGYSESDLAAVPEGADMGLGCGNPQAIAGLKEGENVLDLGAGGGFDCFLAAKQVGPSGLVIGVDMTPEMIAKARRNAQQLGTTNVDFRLGEIEHLPVSDSSIDVILSNCVVNLSPDKAATFREAFRVLKPGGRLAISDVVATAPIPDAIKNNAAALSSCISGAASVDAIRSMLQEAGFQNVRVDVNADSRSFIRTWEPGSKAEDYVASAAIEAWKPNGKSCCGPTCCAPETSA